MSIRFHQRRSIPLFLLAALASFAACGGDAESPDPPVAPAHQRLSLVPDPPYPDELPVVVTRFEPSEEALRTWGIDASGASLVPLSEFDVGSESEPDREPAMVLALRGVHNKILSLPLDDGTEDFNAVRVFMRCSSPAPARVKVVLLKERSVVQASPITLVHGRPGFSAVEFDFPGLQRWEVQLSEVRIIIGGDPKAAQISVVELLRRPPIDFVPAREGHGELVMIADQHRRGVGLSSRHPLHARVHVRSGSWLEFSYCLPRELRMPGETPQLKVSVATDGVPPLRETLPLEPIGAPSPIWHEATLELEDFADREVEVTFELVGRSEHERFAIVAEVAVSRTVDSPTTVLLITSDTHRGDHLGLCSEDAPVRTPNLDALGERGVFFARAFASTNSTNPSHVAMMTATSPRDTHVLDNATPLVERAETLAERFAELGYRTMAAISTTHLLHATSGLGQGFDRVDGPLAGQRPGDATLSELEPWLARAEGRPLFLWLHLFDAHSPYEPPPGYDRRYWTGPDPYAENGTSPPPARVIRKGFEGITESDFPYQQYRAEVDYVDELVGRALDLPRLRSAIVAFTADHGESFGEHGIWWNHIGLYPQTVGVPLILSWPGGPRGLRSDVPVSNVDIARTLLDLAGHETIEFPGRDLRWALEENAEVEPLFELSARGFTAAVQTLRYRLVLQLRDQDVHSAVTRREQHQVELYDVLTDPDCEMDLAREEAHYETARGLRALLIRWLESAPASGLADEAVTSARVMDDLEALGYTDGGGKPSGASFYEEDPENEWCRYFER